MSTKFEVLVCQLAFRTRQGVQDLFISPAAGRIRICGEVTRTLAALPCGTHFAFVTGYSVAVVVPLSRRLSVQILNMKLRNKTRCFQP